MKDVPQGIFKLTYYYNVFESTYPAYEETVPIYNYKDSSVIAYARRSFVEDLKIEGTGVLADGTMVNLDGPCIYDDQCFFKIDAAKYPYGIGSQSNPLHPLRSVAADNKVLPFGARIYIRELDGVCLPKTDRFDPKDEGFEWDEQCNGYRHDGCVVVDDIGYGVSGNHLDFFALSLPLFMNIGERMGWVDSVQAYTGVSKCENL